MTSTPQHWLMRIRKGGKPAYILIPELIAEDIHKGLLSARDPLPTLRELARDLGLNYTTCARGYAQARKRGLIDSHVGIGTVVRGSHPSIPIQSGTSAAMTMNAPPEPDCPALLEDLQREASTLFAPGRQGAPYDLLRYQDFGGSHLDREAGVQWLRSHLPRCDASEVLVAPGTHSVLLAALSMLVRPGQTVCVESLCYPGIKVLAAQLGIKLQAIAMDEEGLDPNGFEHVCKTMRPSALICNPTIHNPTTATMGRERRENIADIALRYSVPIIEDDAYAKLSPQDLPTLSTLAPDLTYYIGGLSKSIGSGLRIAYVHAPSVRQTQRLAGALRATTVMASPITAALATRWIVSGCAHRLLEAVRNESAARQAMAARCLNNVPMQTSPHGFHLWIKVPAERNPVELAMALRERNVPCVASVAFATDANPPAAIRLSLGGTFSGQAIERALELTANALLPHATLAPHAL